MSEPHTTFARLANRRAVRLSDVPRLPIDAFGATIADAVASDWRIVSLFGTPESATSLCLIAVLADDERGQLGAASAIVGDRFPSVAAVCAQAAPFEREIAEQCGVIPEGHPRLAPLRRHPPDHRPTGWPAPASPFRRDSYEFARPASDGNARSRRGTGARRHHRARPLPIPGARRGSAVVGDHARVSAPRRGGPARDRGSVARDSGRRIDRGRQRDRAHASAYCGAIEAVSRCHKSARAQSIRGIALELERLANHIGDLGALAGDVAYQPAAAFFGRLRGECLNMLMSISGNRYGRGLIRPGGVTFDVPPEMTDELDGRVRRLEQELRPVADLFFGTPSVQARLEGVGVVSRDACVTHGFVGPVARACEVHRDVRHDHPYGVFRYTQIPVATARDGDVFARALIRWVEIQRSLEFVREQLGALPGGDIRVPCGALAPSELVVAIEEGWRGEVVHAVLTDDRGQIRRHKVTDPSFRNWAAVALAMPGNQISDFPLCNKSFNLSYAGHDL